MTDYFYFVKRTGQLDMHGGQKKRGNELKLNMNLGCISDQKSYQIYRLYIKAVNGGIWTLLY
jgi:hypothetical protein